MAHFAQIDDDNIVTNVIVVHNNELLDDSGDEQESLGSAFCSNLLGGTWKQTSYNSTFRKNFAGTGYTYDTIRNAFIAPQPSADYVLNEQTCQWDLPL
jgi:hypothetical protein